MTTGAVPSRVLSSPDLDADDADAAPSGARPIPSLRAGRYRIESILDDRGWCVVYSAHDLVLGREVALKELRMEKAPDPGVLFTEARALAAIRHTNVLTLYGVEIPKSGPPFLVMERMSGVDLETILARGRPPLKETLWLLRQAAAGIDAIHAAGRFHGDVRPANVLVDDGVVKIADFGMAALLSTMEAGEVIGTPGYMPPERAAGAIPERALAPKSDVFSFAVVATEMLTGHRLFDARAKDVAEAIATMPRPSELGGLSRAFDEPLLRALHRSPVYRPKSCRALVDALEKAAEGADHEGRPLRVLVADDDSDQRVMWSHALAWRLRGAIVETVSDGDQAIEAIRQRPPAIVMLDLVMPGLRGPELLDEIGKLAPEAAVFVITGHGSGAEWRVAKERGVHRFFVKPCEIEDVATAIRDVVRRAGAAARARRRAPPDAA